MRRWRGARTKFECPTVNEGNKYRSMATHMREQANAMVDRAIHDQFVKIAERYEELAEQVEAANRRAD